MRHLLLIAFGLLVAPGMARASDKMCGSSQREMISAQARCVDQGGVSLGDSVEDDSSTFACLQSKEVQNRCGPDGSLTRLRAFQGWLKKVKAFEEDCTSKGGAFSYEDPHFMEPTSESFCAQAVPEISTNMFEDSLCNFQSACPEVKVRCETTCSGPSFASLY